MKAKDIIRNQPYLLSGMSDEEIVRLANARGFEAKKSKIRNPRYLAKVRTVLENYDTDEHVLYLKIALKLTRQTNDLNQQDLRDNNIPLGTEQILNSLYENHFDGINELINVAAKCDIEDLDDQNYELAPESLLRLADWVELVLESRYRRVPDKFSRLIQKAERKRFDFIWDQIDTRKYKGDVYDFQAKYLFVMQSGANIEGDSLNKLKQGIEAESSNVIAEIRKLMES